jgi:hypothetical protein
MINKIKNLFSRNKPLLTKTNNEDYSYLLNLLENNRKWSELEGRYFYDERGVKLKVLGVYSYPDIDMTKTGIIVKYESGKIDDIHVWSHLLKNKPHDWFTLLDTKTKLDYSRNLNDDFSYEDLEKKYYSKIPIDNSREWKLKQLGI